MTVLTETFQISQMEKFPQIHMKLQEVLNNFEKDKVRGLTFQLQNLL